MKFSVLGSGSAGNSVYIESAETAILIDAGFSGKEMEKRLVAIGRSIESVQAICITHEHRDHVAGVGVLGRRHGIPVWGNERTLQAGERITKKIPQVREFETGDILQIGDLELRSFSVMHDGSDPVGYVVSRGEKSLGYCTDTGYFTHLMMQRLANCQALILESNHDPDLLRMGPYPLPLQQRVRSREGHLCNDDCVRFWKELVHDGLQHTVLAHLSETNNSPDHARRAIEPSLAPWPKMQLHIAAQSVAMPLVDIN